MQRRMLVVWIVAVVGALVWSASPAAAESPPSGAVPFPVGKTTKLRAQDGPTYFIDGPTVIPKNVEITVQLDVRIIGINGASLDVQGGLKVHGTQDHWVVIRNVDFSPTREPTRGLHLDMVDFFGCRFVHGEDDGFIGDVVIENAAMQRDCAFDVRMIEGKPKLMTVDSAIPWKIRCDPLDAKRPKIEIQIRSSWAREVELTGPCEATLRHSEFQDGLTFRGVTNVTVDGCDIYDGTLAFHQGPADSFKKITLTKCNIFEGSTVVLDRAPNPEAKKEKVKLDKFYFGPKADVPPLAGKDVVADAIEDGADDPERKVFAIVGKRRKRRHDLVSYEGLRLRVPPIR